jgi:4-amino-4-deoxy-L-arabinose transferase-like glycosyltransferase
MKKAIPSGENAHNLVLNTVNITSLLQQFPLPLILAFGFVLRLYHVNAPIIGIHAWRQSDTAAIARNYYENGFRLLYPQIDWGGITQGYVETEFPLYAYIVSFIYRLLGFSDSYGRLLSAIFGVITIYFMYKLVRLVTTNKVALWSAFFFAVLPLCVFYSRTFQPESMLIMSCVIGLYGFVHWLQNRQGQYLILSVIFITLASLLKVMPLVYVGLPLIFLTWRNFKIRMFLQWRLWAYAAIVLVVTFLWYHHARQIYQATGLSFFPNQFSQATGLSFSLLGDDTGSYPWRDLVSLRFWGDIVLRLVVRHFAIFGVVFLLVGLLRRDPTFPKAFFAIGMASVMFTCVISPTSSYVHEYYQLPLLIYAVPLIAKGWVDMRAGIFRFSKSLAYSCLGLLVTAGTVIYAIDYMSKEIPVQSATYNLAQQVRAVTPSEARIISVTNADPNLLYLSHRKGWLASPDGVNLDYLQTLAQEGAEYLVGSYQVVESHSHFTDEAQKAALRSLVDEHLDPLVHTDEAYIASLAPLGHDLQHQ